ncbi:MAG: hypothetical protein C0436_01975 [Alphaproteobacteria bacterium]|nr:hypothetical protein [Alphaproteobacteria bacterium]
MTPKKPHRKGRKPTRSESSSATPTREAAPAAAAHKKPFVRVGKKHREEQQKHAHKKPIATTAEKAASTHRTPKNTTQKPVHPTEQARPRRREARGSELAKPREGGEPSLAPSVSNANHAIRVAKRIADAGICSRREAEKLIEQGRVDVNGKTIHTPAITVTSKDYVKIDGKLIRNTAVAERLFLYHKPRGLITTTRDTHNRPTVFENLPKELPRLISVGRLDLDSEGLLLLTTSGSIARNLELPANAIKRTYRVRILGTVQPESIAKLARGITVEGVHYGPIIVRPEPATGDGRNRWVEVTLTEGKNREIRRVFESLGHTVSRLIRTSYGPFTLGKLPRGMVMEMKPADWKKALKEIMNSEQ